MTVRVGLHFVDNDADVSVALADAFRAYPEVTIEHNDIMVVATNTLVSPANSYGYMDGGIDLVYRNFFGPAVEAEVRRAIDARPEGYLPVGASLYVATQSPRIPYLIVAPTMVLPEVVPKTHCYSAMRAVLRVAEVSEEIGRAVYCPGLATGVGRVEPEVAASEMAAAYEDWKAARGWD